MPENQPLPALDTLPFSLVIATFERADELPATFAGIETQTLKPLEILVIDSSRDHRTRDLCAQWAARLPIRYTHSTACSAAKQRNQGADLTHPAAAIIGFMDDDITLQPDTCQKILTVFQRDTDGKTGGISVRIDDIHRPIPSRLTRLYLRLQAGYPHPTYGAKLLGPAINCLPTYHEPAEQNGTLIPADWLNSGCVFYRRAPFLRERFPAFEGYSYMEDVHLSARIGKTHRLYFHTTATCTHREGTNSSKRDHLAMARMRIRNQHIVAREVQGLRGITLAWKFLLHRLFSTIAILRARDPGWPQALKGTWF
jgi:GT2 family glycosyltransferase